jgi:diguanylate cyclase (GGDEF)-like protein/PAS domain S-box-containing protein
VTPDPRPAGGRAGSELLAPLTRALVRSEQRYALAAQGAADALWDWEAASRRLVVSDRWHELLGWPPTSAQLDPSRYLELVHRDDLSSLRAAIADHLAGRTACLEHEHRMLHSDGSWRWMGVRGLALREPDGRVTRMGGSVADITQRRRAEQQLRHDALYDALTGLPNRALFTDRAGQVLERAVRDPAVGCGVLFLDIDRFKLINDSLSHAIGDSLLLALAQRIAAALRPGDTVARVGGDEFTILLDDVHTVDAAMLVAQRLQEALRRPFGIDRHRLFVTASIGIALSEPDLGAAELIGNADIAMYEAKRRGRARCVAFEDAMRRRAVLRLARENELRQAIDRSLLPIHFQPIVDLASGRLAAFEALVRWPRQWPVVEPRDFIPIAEDAGVISALGMHVLRDALAQLARWRECGLIGEEVGVSVNLSPRQLEDPALATGIRDALERHGLPGSALALEMTETTLMGEPRRIRSVLAEIVEAGVSLHLDDFGTGYSSLSLLHTFPLRAVKVDRGFVGSLGRDDGADAIVRATVAMSHSLGMRVIAEGIEQPEQLDRVRELGCEHGQGFLFAEPLPPAGVAALLGDRSPSSPLTPAR